MNAQMMTQSQDLNARALSIEAWAERHFLDDHGLVYTQIDRATGKPLTAGFFGPDDDPHPVGGADPVGMYSYENCGMTTGAYTQALLERYAASGDPTALERARRGFLALRHIYDMGRQLEAGFFPKIYGGRFSEQTSTDQVLYAVLALDRFSAFATETERREIATMIGKMVGFWVERNYTYHYYHVRDMQWPLARFPSLLLLAFNHTGDTRFQSEYARLLAQGVNRHPGESRLRRKRNGEMPPSDFEREHQAWVLSGTADAVTMDIMELDYVLRNDPDNEWAACWRRSVELMWAEGTASLAPDGRVYVQCLVDMQTGESRPMPPRSPGSCSYMRYCSGARSGWSSMIARAGVQALPYLAAHGPARETINHILGALDVETLTYVDDPERFAPEHRFMTRFLSGDALANWLWAYWLLQSGNKKA